MKVKIVNFFNSTRLLLKSYQDFCFQVAFVNRIREMKPDYSYLCMLPIDHEVTDDHQIYIFIGFENQFALGEW